MGKKLLICFIAAIYLTNLFVIPTTALGDEGAINLVSDYSLEQSSSLLSNAYWAIDKGNNANVNVTLVNDAAQAHTGNQSVKMTGRARLSDTIRSAEVPIKRSRIYEYAAWVKLPVGASASTFGLQALFSYQNASGGVVKEWKVITASTRTAVLPGTWTEVKCLYTYTPADKWGDATVRLDVLESGTVSGEIWLDDYRITPVTDAVISGHIGILASAVSEKRVQYRTNLKKVTSWNVTDINGTALTNGITIDPNGVLTLPPNTAFPQEIMISASGEDYTGAKNIYKTIKIGENKINLVQDAGFEESPDISRYFSWLYCGTPMVNLVSEGVKTGSKAVKITNRVSCSDGLWTADTKIQKNRAYQYAGWVKSPAVVAASSTSSATRFNLYGSFSGGLVTGWVRLTESGVFTTVNANEWTYVSCDYTYAESNPTDAYASVRLRINENTWPSTMYAGEIWLDDHYIIPKNVQNTIEIDGVSSLVIPMNDTISTTFGATVKNQFGTAADMPVGVKWSVENAPGGVQIDENTGVLTVSKDTTAENITVLASVSEFDITTVSKKIITLDISDENAVSKMLDRLTADSIANENLNCVTKNVNLRTSGYYETQITWVSDHDTVLSDSGVVAQQENQDVNVNLTATVTKGNVTASKTFRICVSRKEKVVRDGGFDNTYAITRNSAPWIHLKTYTGHGDSTATYEIIQEAGHGNAAKISNRTHDLDNITQGIQIQTNTDYLFTAWAKALGRAGQMQNTYQLVVSGHGTFTTQAITLADNQWAQFQSVIHVSSAMDETITLYLFVKENASAKDDADNIIRRDIVLDDFSVVLSTPKKFGVDFGLNESYGAITGTTVAERFAQRKAELPQEIPVMEPFDVSAQTQFFVATDGNDNASGSISAPFATLERALLAVRAVSDKSGGIAIFVREGTYPVSAGAELLSSHSGLADAPLFISAYQNEKVTFTNGITIPGSAFTAVSDYETRNRFYPYAVNHILVADLTALGIQDYGSLETVQPLLLLDDQQMQLARWPNGSEEHINGVLDRGPVTEASSPYYTDGVNDGRGFEYTFGYQRPFNWVNTGDLWIDGAFFAEFSRQQYRIRSINPQTNSIRTMQHCVYGARHNPIVEISHYYYNIMEELDIPGEWYLDRESGKLYIYPPNDSANFKLTFTANNNALLKLNGSSNVVINKLNFNAGAGSAITIKGGSQNIVQNCTISNMRENGISISGSKNGVIYSDFINIGGRAVITEAPNPVQRAALLPFRNFVQNCHVYGAKYGILLNGIGNIASHNLIQHTKSPSVYLADSTECIVEYNEITGGPYQAKDAGGLYVLGSATNRGNHIRYNYWHDLINAAAGLYCDDMSSENYLYGNIVDGTQFSSQLGGGKENVITNNIFLNGTTAASRDGLFYYDDRWAYFWEAVVKYQFFTCYMDESNTYYYVDVYQSPWAERFPSLVDYTTKMKQHIAQRSTQGYVRNDLENEVRAPANNHYQNNLLVNTPWFSFSDVALSTTTGLDTNYQTTDNPGFVDMTSKNYNLTLNASVYSNINGFAAPPFSRMGLTGGKGRSECPSLGQLAAIAPYDTSNGAIYASDASLQWTPVMGANKYILTLAEDEAFHSVVGEYTTSETCYPLKGLAENTTYYWKVTAVTEAKSIQNASVASEVFAFQTASADSFALSVSTLIIADANGNRIQKADGNTDFYVKAQIENTSQNEKEVTIALAIYRADHSLAAVQYNTAVIGTGLTETDSTFLTGQQTQAGWYAKAFVFDGTLKPLKPLGPAIVTKSE